MKTLLTGANGFVGSHVAEALAAAGVETYLMVRRTSRLTYLEAVDHDRVEADLRDTRSLEHAVRGMDTVVHMAGLTMGLAISEAEYHEVNALGTAHLVEAARRAGVRHFVYVSSLAAQGPTATGSKEPPAPPRPVSAYGRSKLAGEFAALASSGDMNVSIIRLPVVYGQRDRALLPFYRMAKLGAVPVYGDGRNLLSWVHVLDAAGAIAAVARAQTPSGALYTISDGVIYTWRSLVEAFGKVLGRPVRLIPLPPLLFNVAGQAGGLAQALTRRPLPMTPDQVRHMRAPAWTCDHEAITRDLGWKPSIDLEEGFTQAYRWYREQRLL